MNDIVKLQNPEFFFKQTEQTFLVFRRDMNTDLSIDFQHAQLAAFRDSLIKVSGMINRNVSTYQIEHTSQLDAVDLGSDQKLNVLTITLNLGYAASFALLVMIGKFANIMQANPSIDFVKLFSQMFSNQSNPSMTNYRWLYKLMLNGDIVEALWNNFEDYDQWIPERIVTVTGNSKSVTWLADRYKEIEPPRWCSLSKVYVSEKKMIAVGL